tara:strand:- start:1194 stop:1478 length:285 start_codon:yes stop_codon:yes gene_type:complete
MPIENNNELLREQLGKHRCDVIATTAMTGKSYYAIHFPVTSVIASIAAANATTATGSAISNLHTTISAGTTIFLNVTAITLTSGVALCYYEDVI